MRLFLDTEFNEFLGPVISMALVPEVRSIPPFYESSGCENPGPWVAEHVMPIIGMGRPATQPSWKNHIVIVEGWYMRARKRSMRARARKAAWEEREMLMKIRFPGPWETVLVIKFEDKEQKCKENKQ